MENIDDLSYDDIMFVIDRLRRLHAVYDDVIFEFAEDHDSASENLYGFDLNDMGIDAEQVFQGNTSIHFHLPDAFQMGGLHIELEEYLNGGQFTCYSTLPKNSNSEIVDSSHSVEYGKKLPQNMKISSGIQVNQKMVSTWMDILAVMHKYHIAAVEPLARDFAFSPIVSGLNWSPYVLFEKNSGINWKAFLKKYRKHSGKFSVFLDTVEREAVRRISKKQYIDMNNHQAIKTAKDYLNAMAFVIADRTQRGEDDMRGETLHSEVQKLGVATTQKFTGATVANAKIDLKKPPYGFRFVKNSYKLEPGFAPQVGKFKIINARHHRESLENT